MNVQPVWLIKQQGTDLLNKDIERIKRHQATGESQEKVLKDLAGYFLSVA
ncbi:hypothetical protein VBK25_01665 [Enterobacter hormaechei]|nr:hypothetical protein [Enterobacter hormaechei]MEA3806150.1 hypothetical protein [Enterobacter hormaechei]MEA3815063.1 hypothetical protein [Enterobacter hormaechei]